MKYFLQSIALFIYCSAYGQAKSPTVFINPTGTYKLGNRIAEKDGDTYGYFGEIKVKLLPKSKIAITLFVCKGAPSYNSGTIWDTLTFKNSKALCTTPDDDSTCKITFRFKKNGVSVDQQQANLNFGCGFGHGVFADGYYRKISSKIPVINEPAEY